ncbi:hypothetical protein HK44_012065 [Pseudomonas fluorescens HK44]|uniref:Uncharacterized protein n=1 Tax=Pseudomonas fluorescens HK44 TaxID=1042209 RepID=A0A010SMR3_PSEFL|nr:hypothetical protein HK44_012065 [Pseudomonas fluorescens HK44]
MIQQIGLSPNITIEENITIVARLLGWDKQQCRALAADAPLLLMDELDRRYVVVTCTDNKALG